MSKSGCYGKLVMAVIFLNIVISPVYASMVKVKYFDPTRQPGEQLRWITLELEDYLPGVVEYEMGTGYPLSALMAQAVVSRSYARYHFEVACSGEGHYHSDPVQGVYINATTGDQVWHPQEPGGGRIYPYHFDIIGSVHWTQGETLYYNSRVVFAEFHGNCGGVTTVNDNWGNPYLIDRADAVHSGPIHGHRRGLCQRGAIARAQAGDYYANIALYYYNGVSLSTPLSLVQKAQGVCYYDSGPVSEGGGGGGSGGDPGCLRPDALIATPTGSQAIQDVKVGDQVMGWDGKKMVATPVEQVLVHDGTWTLYRYKDTWYTGNHKVMDDGKFVEVRTLSQVTQPYQGKVYHLLTATKNYCVTETRIETSTCILENGGLPSRSIESHTVTTK